MKNFKSCLVEDSFWNHAKIEARFFTFLDNIDIIEL